MRKTNQRGFSAIEGLLILIVIGVLGFVGWYVWHSKKNTDSTYSSANSSSQVVSYKAITSFDECVKAGKPVAESFPETCSANGKSFTNDKSQDKWFLYTPKGKEYSMRIPDGWKLTDFEGTGHSLYAFDMSDIPFKRGTKASVQVTHGGRDFNSVAFLLGYGATSSAPNDDIDRATKMTGFKTDAGVAVSEYYFLQTKSPGEVMDLPLGAKRYIFDIESKGHGVLIYHDVLKGEKDQLKYIAPMIKSLKFLK